MLQYTICFIKSNIIYKLLFQERILIPGLGNYNFYYEKHSINTLFYNICPGYNPSEFTYTSLYKKIYHFNELWQFKKKKIHKMLYKPESKLK